MVVTEELRERLYSDTQFWARHTAKIVSRGGTKPIPLIPNPPQERFDAVMERQISQGKPVRVLILKARKLGFCLAPHTRVLTADLRWAPIDSLQPGDELVGTDEDVPGGRGRGRKMRRSVVEGVRHVRESAYRIVMDNGQELVATGPHRFLSRWGKAPETHWREVHRLRPGNVIRYVTEPWDEPAVEDGWFGGLVDGEGCLRAKETGGTELTVSQVPGTVLERAASYLEARGYTYRESLDERRRANGHQALGGVHVHRVNELFRLIGQTRPSRFADSGWWEDHDLPGKRSGKAWARIVSIEKLGKQPMVDLQTSTKTFIAEGFVSHNSTWVQAKVLHRITQRQYRRALVVAQDRDTASELFDIGDRIWVNLPPDPTLALKPYRTHFARGKYMHFGEPSRVRRNAGIVGLDSKLEVDTANEVEAGRGYTYTDLHCSEVAFWPDVRKLTALLNAVPDDPETMVVLESTANGLNHFHDRWQAAEAGESEYATVFAGWTEEPLYTLPFLDAEAKADFVETVGTGPWGEDEPDLIRDFDVTPEQLHWRRKTIVDKCDSKLEVFHQEYPTTPEEAFISSGKHVFSTVLVSRMRKQCEQTDPKTTSPDNPGPELGQLVGEEIKLRKIRSGTIEVPKKTVWSPRVRGGAVANPWRVWQHPEEGGAYVVAGDPSGGEENEKGDTAWHAIQVVDHRTREQCAEWRGRIDPDLVADELLLAALYWNKALIVVETTGGYGSPMLRRIRRDCGYPLVYRRRPLSKDRDRQEEKLGWDTGPGTKGFLEAHAQQLLRDGWGDEAPETCGYVRSRLLAAEFATYVRDERGRTGPQGNSFADLLMAWQIGEYVAHERPVPKHEQRSSTQTVGRRPRDKVGGW